ncbi:hypothetical protein SAMN05421759_10973 [Roseivivax lentus]|uniref:N-(5'-phosphoribosyl)anthranilate isomerase n=1 Tax=Roseivivax lentus TaxID=633194 RepID=A0A1N7NNZ2_9RHOB|nr:N-(5'-phosphoribosyl)anthranilate isomerase [Roseivivax lentus]SIT00054.1 hypothetical protein SAMN05421759_10973 [Roseivivax lentus]
MSDLQGPLAPEHWLADLFASRAVARGQVIRRATRDVERYAAMDRFIAEVERRGFCAVENSGQVVIFCNRAPIRRLV